MHEEDDFFISFREKVKKDIKEILGLDPSPFEIHLSFSNHRRGRIYTWRDLPTVWWSYRVHIPEEKLTSDYGGYMLLKGSDWTGLHGNIIEELQEYISVRAARRLQGGNMRLEVTNQQDAGPFKFRSQTEES